MGDEGLVSGCGEAWPGMISDEVVKVQVNAPSSSSYPPTSSLVWQADINTIKL
jgi:hypothetical protein